MTRIEFYFNAESKLLAACELAARALRQRLRVLIYAPDDAVAAELERALSAFPSISYTRAQPRGEVPEVPEAPVVIARDAATARHDEVLLNLHDDAPRHFSRFLRLIEVVASAEDDRLAARERFRYYRDRGYAIRHYDMALARS